MHIRFVRRCCSLAVALGVLAAAVPSGAQAPTAAATTVTIAVDATQPGPTMSRHLFGQFAEHLGTGIYEGLWVGPDSPIPNTRGLRTDVVSALKALKVPNVRWPGGCFADEYHWRKGIGPSAERPVTLNPTWGGALEPNTFGTHEFMDLAAQLGADAYLSVNVGSGTVEEAADWLEYLTTAQPSTLGKERGTNGHPDPYEIPFVGLGNENWACGGNMTADYYTSRMKVFSRYVRNFNPAQQKARPMQQIAVGPGGQEPHWLDWTATVMKAWRDREWSWDIQGLSLHNYTVVKWPPAYASVGFGEQEYADILKSTMVMEDLIRQHGAVMDTYDPEKKVALVVDEWGAWYAPLPGSNPGFLVQQNTLRDAVLAALNVHIFARHADRVRMANIAQMVNVLQAMVMTDGPRMVLTPTYHVFRMYVPFQDATVVPVRLDAGRFSRGEITLPRVDAIAARDGDGTLWLAVTNLDPSTPVTIDTAVTGLTPARTSGEVLTAAAVDSHNTFDAPTTVAPADLPVRLDGQRVSATLPPKSVSVIAIHP